MHLRNNAQREDVSNSSFDGSKEKFRIRLPAGHPNIETIAQIKDPTATEAFDILRLFRFFLQDSRVPGSDHFLTVLKRLVLTTGCSVLMKLEGIVAPMATALNSDGAIDVSTTKKLVDFLIEGGIDCLFP